MTLAFLFLSASSDQVFGCSLSDLCHRESSTVPSFVRMCIDHVENNGGFGCVSLLSGSLCEDMTGNDSCFFESTCKKWGRSLRPHDDTGGVRYGVAAVHRNHRSNLQTRLKWCSCFPPMIPCRSVYRRAVQSQREPGCHTETSLCCQSRWVTAFSVTLVFGRKLQKPCGTNKNNLFFSWDPFSPSDLNGFLSCVYDLRTGGEENGLPG